MEIQSEICEKHKMNNEIVCNSCQRFICSQCLLEHCLHNEEGNFVHIFDYAKANIFPIFDNKLNSIENEKSAIEKDPL